MAEQFQRLSRKNLILDSYRMVADRYLDPELKTYEKFTPGIDGVDLREFDLDLEARLEECRQFILKRDKPFHPQLLRRIPKETSGKFRDIYLQTLRDKVIQKAMSLVIMPVMERKLYPNLYSYRQGKYYGQGAAIRQVKKLMKDCASDLYLFKTDISDYTDTIPQDRMYEKFQELFPGEPELIELIKKYIDQPCYREGKLLKPDLGVPAGSPITPLCYNFYLTDLDAKMFRGDFHYFRYGDDILFLEKDRRRFEEGKKLILESLKEHRLKFSQKKTLIQKANQPFTYLGYRFDDQTLSVGENSIKKYRLWVLKELPRQKYWKHPNKTVKQRRKLLQLILRELNVQSERAMGHLSWMRCFPFISDTGALKDLDHFIKNRIRLCITRKMSSRNYELVPEPWFRELGYKSFMGIYFRQSQGRSMDPYVGWRRGYGTNFKDVAERFEKKPFLVQKWRDLKSFVDFIRRAMASGTGGGNIRSG